MTITGRNVNDEFFGRLRQQYDDDAIVELTEIFAWEYASSKFNRSCMPAMLLPFARRCSGSRKNPSASATKCPTMRQAS
jgi:hypothetical protein